MGVIYRFYILKYCLKYLSNFVRCLLEIPKLSNVRLTELWNIIHPTQNLIEIIYSNLRNKRRGTAILSSAIFHPLLTYLRPLRLFFLKLFTKNPFFMSTSGRILADFHPIRTYFGFFNPLRLFIFENGAASTFIRPSTFIPEVRVLPWECPPVWDHTHTLLNQ